MEMTVFIVLAFLSVVSAVLTILWRDPVWSAFSLVVCLLGQAGLYVTLAANFLAAMQILVYAAAVIVLFVVVVKLLGFPTDSAASHHVKFVPYAGGLVVLLLVGKFTKVLMAGQPGLTSTSATIGDDFGSTATVGDLLVQQFLLPFELISLLLLVAMVGAAVIVRRGFWRETP